MAKETKEKAISIMDINEENVSEQLENTGKFSKEIVEAAKKNRKDKDAEKAAREFDELSQQAEYFNFRLVLMSKMYKKASKSIDNTRNKSLDLLKRVEAGELDALGFQKELDELAKEFTKDLDKGREERRDDETRLHNKYPSGNWWTWENKFFGAITSAMQRFMGK